MMSAMSKAAPFSVPRVVDAYKRSVRALEKATTKAERSKLETEIKRLRREWVKGNGSDADELHETAFGG